MRRLAAEKSPCRAAEAKNPVSNEQREDAPTLNRLRRPRQPKVSSSGVTGPGMSDQSTARSPLHVE